MFTAMTRRIAGPSQTKRTRTPHDLPIGHLSTKSSVYSPVSMSRMSQDLVYNHMKSHYQRISSAKACVDTSAPRSMKLTIKEKDRKRKQTLLASNTLGSSSRSSSRQSNYDRKESNSPKGLDISDNFTENCSFHNGNATSSLKHRERQNSRKSSRNHRRHSGTFTKNDDLKLVEHEEGPGNDGDGDLREKRNNSMRHNIKTDEQVNEEFEKRKKDRKPTGTSRIKSNEKTNIVDVNDEEYYRDEYSYERYERKQRNENDLVKQNNRFRNLTDNRTTRSSEESLECEEWNDSRDEMNNDLENTKSRSRDKIYTSTPRLRDENQVEINPNLSTMTYSYKSPPTRRKPRKKNPEETIWTEEQKYLQFISDVTSDILARGICSNRVINKVLESHIEKRKDDLDEENMREMISQLKDDLRVTDD